MKSSIIKVIGLAFGIVLISFSACTPRMALSLAGTAAYTAAVVGTTAAIVAHHDAHYHHDHCGCPHQYHHGRWVYHYQGRWEYYDPEEGFWYSY